jgi:hypothetical protein
VRRLTETGRRVADGVSGPLDEKWPPEHPVSGVALRTQATFCTPIETNPENECTSIHFYLV